MLCVYAVCILQFVQLASTAETAQKTVDIVVTRLLEAERDASVTILAPLDVRPAGLVTNVTQV